MSACVWCCARLIGLGGAWDLSITGPAGPATNANGALLGCSRERQSPAPYRPPHAHAMLPHKYTTQRHTAHMATHPLPFEICFVPCWLSAQHVRKNPSSSFQLLHPGELPTEQTKTNFTPHTPTHPTAQDAS